MTDKKCKVCNKDFSSRNFMSLMCSPECKNEQIRRNVALANYKRKIKTKNHGRI